MFMFNEFLQSSTIHGFSYISTSKRYVRLFWIVVVLTGFLISGSLIKQAFSNWKNDPFKTTIETRPITELTFPNITVCPPRDTFTNLNYDLYMLQNQTISNDTKEELQKFAFEQLHDSEYKDLVKNFSKVIEEEKIKNWYDGDTRIEMPYFSSGYLSGKKLNYFIHTSATSGSVQTQHFGEKFDSNKIENLFIEIHMYPPAEIIKNENYTLTIEIEKNMLDVDDGGKDIITIGIKMLDSNKNYIIHNITGPLEDNYVRIQRSITNKNIKASKLETMPGFKVKWSYNTEVISKKLSQSYPLTVQFKR